jgi:hypothetical protein
MPLWEIIGRIAAAIFKSSKTGDPLLLSKSVRWTVAERRTAGVEPCSTPAAAFRYRVAG